MKKEIWKEIVGFPDYHISSHGRVKSFKKKKPIILAFDKTKDHYLRVALYRNGKRIRIMVHRLVAYVFIAYEKELEINHKDLNRQNNYYENLEWCDRSYNVNYKAPPIDDCPF